MVMYRQWYLRFMFNSNILCIYYVKHSEGKVARITVRKVVFNKKRTIREHKEKLRDGE